MRTGSRCCAALLSFIRAPLGAADDAVAFVSGVLGSLNESSRILGRGSNTVLANNVGPIESSFEERVRFKLDGSQFATETRIFSAEGTGILPPKDHRE